ncbi:MAG: ATP-binding protein [Planctomycetaceae bacterium]
MPLGDLELDSGQLLVVHGVDRGRRFQVASPQLRIGRGVQNEIRILDTEASRRHAVIDRKDGAWRISDAGSSNGTYVNGEAVVSQPLQPGDQIQIGRSILLFTQRGIGESRLVAAADLLHDGESASQIISSVDSAAARSLERQAVPGLSDVASPDPNLGVLYRISEEVVRPSMTLDQMLKRILDLTLQAVGADRGLIFLFDSKTDALEPRVVSAQPGRAAVTERAPVSRTIVEYVIQHGHGIQTSDARHDDRFEEGQSILQAGIREAMCVPIQGRYDLLGALYVDTTTNASAPAPPKPRFSTRLLTLLVAIGRQSALAVENNRYQQALLSAERLAAVGQTIAMLGHDIKNILQAMRGGSYLIDSGLKKEDHDLVRRGWGIVERNQDRIFNLVMDMLSYSKDRPPRLQVADLNRTVLEVAELVQARADLQETELIVETDELPASLFDPDAIHRAVLNVVTNALDALDGQADGRVTLSTRYDEASHSLVLDVADNGPGIPAEEQGQLFKLFASHKGTRGTGLGLAVCRKVLTEHEGDVTVSSQPGEGTTFRLAWPVHEDESEGSSVSRATLPGIVE